MSHWHIRTRNTLIAPCLLLNVRTREPLACLPYLCLSLSLLLSFNCFAFLASLACLSPSTNSLLKWSKLTRLKVPCGSEPVTAYARQTLGLTTWQATHRLRIDSDQFYTYNRNLTIKLFLQIMMMIGHFNVESKVFPLLPTDKIFFLTVQIRQYRLVQINLRIKYDNLKIFVTISDTVNLIYQYQIIFYTMQKIFLKTSI